MVILVYLIGLIVNGWAYFKSLFMGEPASLGRIENLIWIGIFLLMLTVIFSKIDAKK